MARSVGISKTQVIAAAAELADEYGLDRFTLAQVAAKCTVRLPTLYHYVNGMEEIRRELALLAVRELIAVLQKAVIGTSGDAALSAAAHAYRRYVLEHPGRYAATVPAPDPVDTELSQAAGELVSICVAILAPYQLGEAGMVHAVRGLRALAHGFAALEAAGGFGIPLDIDESFRRLVDAFVRGLRVEGGYSE